MKRNLLARTGLLATALLFLIAGKALSREPSSKPLAAYSEMGVGTFTVEKNAKTKDFPDEYVAAIRKNLLEKLPQQKLFDNIVDNTSNHSNIDQTDHGNQVPRKKLVLLDGTVIDYDSGSSAARFATWPLGAGASKLKVRFIFRDAATGQEIFHTDTTGKFYATTSAGIADKEKQLTKTASSVVDSLIKEIRKNR